MRRIFDRSIVHTDEAGRPFERPQQPSPDAGIDAWLEYMRAFYDYNDAVTECHNRAFDREFRRALRR